MASPACSSAQLPYEAQVIDCNGAPRLFLNHRLTAPVFYGLSDIPASRTSTEQAKFNIANFARAGIPLVQIDTELRNCWPQQPATDHDFETLRQEIREVLKAHEDEAVILRLHMNPPVWWMRSHPEEMTVYADGEAEDEGQVDRLIARDLDRMSRVSLASTRWLRDAGERLQALCRVLSDSPEGQHVIGLQIACGVYGEWHQWGFWQHEPDYSQPMLERFRRFLRERYGTDQELRRAWNQDQVSLDTVELPSASLRNQAEDGVFRDPARARAVMDSLHCLQTVGPEAIQHFARIIRTSWPRNILIGAFYGYFFTIGVRAAVGGHLEVHRLLEDPAIDYLSAPFCYDAENRACGGPGISRTMMESIRLNHKLWLTEMDQCPLGTADYPGGGDPARRQESIAVLRRNVLEPLSRGMGFWFYDHRVCPNGSLYEKRGWWEAPELMREIENLQQLAEHCLTRPHRPAADVAVIFDTQMFYYISCGKDNNRRFDDRTLFRTVYQISRTGAVFDSIYLQDLERVQWDRYKAVIFAATPLMTEAQRTYIDQRLKTGNRHLIWCYAPGYLQEDHASLEAMSRLTGLQMRKLAPPPGQEARKPFFQADKNHEAFHSWESWYFPDSEIPADTLRTIFKQAGVHIYTEDFEDVIAGDFGVAVHTATGGTGKVTLPSGETRTVILPPHSTTIIQPAPEL